MKKILFIIAAGIAYYFALRYFREPKLKLLKGAGQHTMTLVLFRHGEKPNLGYGNLNCQGLNRALALPQVMKAKFDDKKPNYVFAPNPMGKVYEGGSSFSYMRPLLTIAPIAISNEMTINTDFNYEDVTGLGNKLKNPVFANSLIFISWEHTKIIELAKMLMSTYNGNVDEIPQEWPKDDYDTIFIFKITRTGDAGRIEFTRDTQGLNGMATEC